jgi:hypothetical protein
MARTTRQPADDHSTRTAARGGWLRGLLTALFARPAGAKGSDRPRAVASDKNDPPVQRRSAKAASVASDRAMYAELSALFKGAPGSREALRHLAAVQHGLKHKDSKGLFLFGADPAHVRTALRQLDGLMPKQPTPGLAALRARMVDAIGTRERRAKRLEMLSPRSDLMQSDRMEVREASATEFDRALQR